MTWHWRFFLLNCNIFFQCHFLSLSSTQYSLVTTMTSSASITLDFAQVFPSATDALPFSLLHIFLFSFRPSWNVKYFSKIFPVSQSLFEIQIISPPSALPQCFSHASYFAPIELWLSSSSYFQRFRVSAE